MRIQVKLKNTFLKTLLVISYFGLSNLASAHCDTINGPVVTAAKKSLQTGNLNYVFVWIKQEYESEIKNAFQQTIAVRKLNEQAANFADRYFFETVVRLHRAGEGVAYTGLKTSDNNLDLAIPAADNAIQTGSVDMLINLEESAIKKGINEHFQKVMSKKKYQVDDISSGREYVDAYVSYIHYVEGIYTAATNPVSGHYPEHNE